MYMQTAMSIFNYTKGNENVKGIKFESRIDIIMIAIKLIHIYTFIYFDLQFV